MTKKLQAVDWFIYLTFHTVRDKIIMNKSFWKNKRVLLTGHTGFKGAWLSRILTGLGADLTGYSLAPPTTPNLFSICEVQDQMTSVIADVRDLDTLQGVFDKIRPELVIHMAAQPLVRESYAIPVETYEINVMGTVNIMECVRQTKSVRSFLNVTTDKVYHNNEWSWGYREIDPLDGHDPYSNSKSCSELVTHAYKNSYFSDGATAISTARAGNVIGGGDFSTDRIIPDCVRAAADGKTIAVRNPNSVRPYQHVLEPLFAYLTFMERQYENASLAGYYNIGPEENDCVTTGELASMFCKHWGNGLTWQSGNAQGPHEANFLKLDCSLAKSVFGWKPRWHVDRAVGEVVRWSKAWLAGEDITAIMDANISDYTEGR